MTLRHSHVVPWVVAILLLANGSAGQQEQQQASTSSEQTPASDDELIAAAASGRDSRAANIWAPTVPARDGVAGYLLADATDRKLNSSDALDSTLADILARNGPDMRPLRDFRDFADISVDVAKRAWQLMHDHAQAAIVGRLNATAPIVRQVLEAAKVSVECASAASKTMEAAQRLDSWAVQMLTAWGNFPPVGFFEGTFGDVGSFYGCINVPENPIVGHAHYCTIAYRPVLPVRKEYELIIRTEPDELLHLFDRKRTAHRMGRMAPDEDAFSELLRHAQYNHYVYYKFGACFPIQCSPIDVQLVAKLLGRESILMSGPVKCHSKFEGDYEEPVALAEAASSNSTTQVAERRPLQISTRDLNNGVYIWKPHITRTQVVALAIIALVSAFIVSMTLVDVLLVRVPDWCGAIVERRRRSITPHKAQVATKRQSAATCPKLQPVRGDLQEDAEFDPNNNLRMRALNGTSDGQSVDDSAHYYDVNMFKTVPLDDDDDNGEPPLVGQPNQRGLARGDLTDEDRGDQVLRVKQGGQLNGKFKSKEPAAGDKEEEEGEEQQKTKKQRSLFMEIVNDCSIVTNVGQFFRVSQSQLNNDILCINGIRCITMSWIIITHTMQYNDWSAFARTREIETHLKSLINQPLFNGSYLVDTFFLVSGLLTSLSSFRSTSRRRGHSTGEGAAAGPAPTTRHHQGTPEADSAGWLAKFSPRSYLIGRYLRLTPQIMLVSMLFIVLPLLSRSGGPHWYTITGEYSENCSQNWWLNLFYIQAFYRSDEMCNFVCWWISVDMFYHLFALAVILLILGYGHRAGLLSCACLVLAHWAVQATRHYQLGLPPNLLSTIPQTGAMWSEMTLKSFWTPYAHAFPFFLGLYLGYLMARRGPQLAAWFNLRRALTGWTLAIGLLLLQSYSTYYWVVGDWRYTRPVATLFYLVCPIIWASCLSWIIVACHFGYGSWINSMLSCKLFIVLGKASYIVYLSHFLVLFTFFGSQNLLLEPTQLVMLYVVIGNICLSMMLGSCLCVVYEMPWLKAQRRIMKYIR